MVLDRRKLLVNGKWKAEWDDGANKYQYVVLEYYYLVPGSTSTQ